MIGVILSSKFIEDELVVEFGEILPVELPLFNKPLLAHQLEYLSKFCEQTFLTLPEGYKINNYNLNFNELNVSKSLSLLDVLKYISKYFELDDILFIHYGDTIFRGIENQIFDLVENNIFFVKTPLLEYKWGPSFKDTTDVPAGAIIVKNSVLIEHLNRSDSFHEFANNIFSDSKFLKFSKFEWYDFGHALSYYQSRKQFLETRYFNSIKPFKKYLKKESSNIFKMWCEFSWLSALKLDFPNNIPYVTNFSIKNSSASYDIEYINKAPLSDIFVFGNISEKREMHILNNLHIFLNELHSTPQFNFENNISENFICNKLNFRKSEILDFVIQNNYDLLLFENMINQNLEFFQNYSLVNGVIHGDFCFSNIIYDSSSDCPIIYDPRGFTDENVGFSMYGPINYDVYKLAHSYVTGYDNIIANHRTNEYFNKENLKKRLVLFNKIFKINESELLNGLINLFLSMIPLHKDNTERQIKFLNMSKLLYEL